MSLRILLRVNQRIVQDKESENPREFGSYGSLTNMK